MKGKITEKDIFRSLPGKNQSLKQIGQLYVLSRYSDSSELLGQYKEYYFTEKAALDAKEKFQQKLKEIGDRISKRGWDHMHPNKVMASVAI